MKRLYSVGPCKTELREVEEPVITNPDEVKVKLTGCGVCMSEHYDWEHAEEARKFGHEPVGVVADCDTLPRTHRNARDVAIAATRYLRRSLPCKWRPETKIRPNQRDNF